MSAGPQISVVIPTYQRRPSVLRALESLSAQSLVPASYEVVTVIDGSTDGTTDAVRRLDAPYRLVAVEQANRGRAAACNAGVRRAAGEVIVFLDDDMEAERGLLEAHWCAHAEADRCLVLGSVPIVLETGAPPLVDYRARRFQSRLAALAAPGYRLTYSDIYTGNASARRAVLLEAGLFDEAFGVYGHEDYELALRLQRAGVAFVFSPRAVAHQHYEKTFPALARDSVARGRTAVLFSRKHPEVTRRLKLGQGAPATAKWRALRALLLGLTRAAPATVGVVTRAMEWIERRRPRRLDRYYDMALDYYYWVGVGAARAETRAREPEPT
jgi:glycosyltransferase involved in cell wall biosynthesis